ncbi:KH domain-containing protein [Candidatus Falkowbacteria bacterium]|nr:KH domain-containing protein [Candidatus Falkowbacteria bacterium]
MADFDKEFLEFIVKAIVGNPKDVKVDRTIDERGVLLTLNINPADMGYVIGKQGQTAKSIRTLLKIVGAKNNARVNLKINEPEGSLRSRERVSRERVDTDVVDDLKI